MQNKQLLPDLSRYTIITKFSCLETRTETNDPKIEGKKYKLVHFVLVELPSKVCLTLPEEYLANHNPKYYHEVSCRHWQCELNHDKRGAFSSILGRLRELGLGEDGIKKWEFTIELAYFAIAVYPPLCPCGGKQSVRERQQGKVSRIHLQCNITCEFSRLANRCWYRKPFPHCPVCRDRSGKTIPLMQVDTEPDGMGQTNFLCEVCHNYIDKLSVWFTDLLKYIG